MVIIGGKNSSIRKTLRNLKKTLPKHLFVEKIEDLPLRELAKCNKIGVAAGASTHWNA